MIKDFSTWKVYDGANEGSGRSEKIWIENISNGQIGLFKYKKDIGTKDHVSEKLASSLGRLIGIPCAQIDIGYYRGNEGSMSYLINSEHENLIEGIWLISQHYPEYSGEKMYDKSLCEYYSLYMLLKSVKEYGLVIDLLKMLIFDFLIGNSDRHQSNWAIIQSKEGLYSFSPLYDNSSSLCCYIKEEAVDSYLGSDLLKLNSLVKTKSKSIVRIDGSDKRKPTHEAVLRYISEHFHEKLVEFFEQIECNITAENIDEILQEYSTELLSCKRKKLIKLFLMEKVKLMKEIVKGKEA